MHPNYDNAKQQPKLTQEGYWSLSNLEPAQADDGPQTVNWQSAEFPNLNKSSSWYLLVLLCAIAAVALVFWLTKDLISVVALIIVALMFVVSAGRKPKTISYELTNTGIAINNNFYSFGSLKSFAVVPEGPITTILLLPMKRFMPPIGVYCPATQEEKIIGALSGYLPFEYRKSDPIENLMRRIRF